MRPITLLISVLLLGIIHAKASSHAFAENELQSDFTIQCNDISDNGIGSAYVTHIFSLSKGNANIAKYEWKFLLKDKLGNFKQIANSYSESFTIPAVSFPEQYYVNVSGDLEGRIECDYVLNGKDYSATPITLSLELKPAILSISDITINESGPYEFFLTFDVCYVGADKLSVEVEEEYDTSLIDYRFDEPYLAHVKTGNITNLYYSWVTVVVSNEYGTVSETLEFKPITASTTELATPDARSIEEIAIFTLDGRQIFKGTESDFENNTFKPGVYIKKETYDEGYTKTSKIMLR